MIIKVLGSGCANCKKLEANVHQALTESAVKAEVVKVTDYAEISSYGIMRTPGLVIDEKIHSFGKIATVEDIKGYIQSHA